jgi:homogentisate 1,2-dioxygenase
VARLLKHLLRAVLQKGANNNSPGTLPQSVNAPQRIKYDLYSEQLNGSSFVSARKDLQHAWFYRIFPSVAHGRIKEMATNPDVS